MIHHKAGKMNKGVDALSRRYLLVSTLESKVLSFECVKEIYDQNKDFKEIYEKFSSHAHALFHMENGCFFFSKETGYEYRRVRLENS